MDNITYEFIFTDNFSETVFSAYNLASPGLKVEVEKVVNSLKSILRIKPGIRVIASFVNYDSNKYKVSLINSSWVRPAGEPETDDSTVV